MSKWLSPIYCYCSFFQLLSQTSHGNRQNDIVVAQSFIDCLTKWAWPKHMRGNAPNHTEWNFNKKLGKTSLMFSTSTAFASSTESNWKIRLFPMVLLNWMENFTTITISFSEEQFFYRKCIESFSSLKWVRSSDPEMIYRSQSSTWFMLGSEDGNMIFFRQAFTHTFYSWGYVLHYFTKAQLNK